MNSRVTLGLLVILVILGGITYFSNRSGAGTVSGTPTPNMAVFTFTPGDVKSLKVEYQGKAVTVEQTADHNWKLVEPAAQYSDSTRIAGVAASLTGLQKDRDVPMGTNPPGAFGLDKP